MTLINFISNETRRFRMGGRVANGTNKFSSEGADKTKREIGHLNQRCIYLCRLNVIAIDNRTRPACLLLNSCKRLNGEARGADSGRDDCKRLNVEHAGEVGQLAQLISWHYATVSKRGAHGGYQTRSCHL